MTAATKNSTKSITTKASAHHSYKNELQSALAAARLGGAILKKKYGCFKKLREKPQAGLVTEVDHASERVIIGYLRGKHPDHGFLGEETGRSGKSSEHRWIIDPLDGTTNYVHGFPFFCVSIGLEHRGQLVVGVVHNPISQQTYYGRRGGGAFLNGKPLRVSAVTKLKDALLTTGFSYKKEAHLKEELKAFERILRHARAMRRTGSAALDLCHVASGQFDGFFEQGLSPWDVAAGLVILNEAGGKYSTYNGDDFNLESPNIVATNGKIHRVLLRRFSA
jgi:myo-inositol-1(or 4)-monophosphatase